MAYTPAQLQPSGGWPNRGVYSHTERGKGGGSESKITIIKKKPSKLGKNLHTHIYDDVEVRIAALNIFFLTIYYTGKRVLGGGEGGVKCYLF